MALYNQFFPQGTAASDEELGLKDVEPALPPSPIQPVRTMGTRAGTPSPANVAFEQQQEAPIHANEFDVTPPEAVAWRVYNTPLGTQVNISPSATTEQALREFDYAVMGDFLRAGGLREEIIDRAVDMFRDKGATVDLDSLTEGYLRMPSRMTEYTPQTSKVAPKIEEPREIPGDLLNFHEAEGLLDLVETVEEHERALELHQMGKTSSAKVTYDWANMLDFGARMLDYTSLSLSGGSIATLAQDIEGWLADDNSQSAIRQELLLKLRAKEGDPRAKLRVTTGDFRDAVGGWLQHEWEQSTGSEKFIAEVSGLGATLPAFKIGAALAPVAWGVASMPIFKLATRYGGEKFTKMFAEYLTTKGILSKSLQSTVASGIRQMWAGGASFMSYDVIAGGQKPTAENLMRSAIVGAITSGAGHFSRAGVAYKFPRLTGVQELTKLASEVVALTVTPAWLEDRDVTADDLIHTFALVGFLGVIQRTSYQSTLALKRAISDGALTAYSMGWMTKERVAALHDFMQVLQPEHLEPFLRTVKTMRDAEAGMGRKKSLKEMEVVLSEAIENRIFKRETTREQEAALQVFAWESGVAHKDIQAFLEGEPMGSQLMLPPPPKPQRAKPAAWEVADQTTRKIEKSPVISGLLSQINQDVKTGAVGVYPAYTENTLMNMAKQVASSQRGGMSRPEIEFIQSTFKELRENPDTVALKGGKFLVSDIAEAMIRAQPVLKESYYDEGSTAGLEAVFSRRPDGDTTVGDIRNNIDAGYGGRVIHSGPIEHRANTPKVQHHWLDEVQDYLYHTVRWYHGKKASIAEIQADWAEKLSERYYASTFGNIARAGRPNAKQPKDSEIRKDLQQYRQWHVEAERAEKERIEAERGNEKTRANIQHEINLAKENQARATGKGDAQEIKFYRDHVKKLQDALVANDSEFKEKMDNVAHMQYDLETKIRNFDGNALYLAQLQGLGLSQTTPDRIYEYAVPKEIHSVAKEMLAHGETPNERGQIGTIAFPTPVTALRIQGHPANRWQKVPLSKSHQRMIRQQLIETKRDLRELKQELAGKEREYDEDVRNGNDSEGHLNFLKGEMNKVIQDIKEANDKIAANRKILNARVTWERLPVSHDEILDPAKGYNRQESITDQTREEGRLIIDDPRHQPIYNMYRDMVKWIRKNYPEAQLIERPDGSTWWEMPVYAKDAQPFKVPGQGRLPPELRGLEIPEPIRSDTELLQGLAELRNITRKSFEKTLLIGPKRKQASGGGRRPPIIPIKGEDSFNPEKLLDEVMKDVDHVTNAQLMSLTISQINYLYGGSHKALAPLQNYVRITQNEMSPFLAEWKNHALETGNSMLKLGDAKLEVLGEMLNAETLTSRRLKRHWTDQETARWVDKKGYKDLVDQEFLEVRKQIKADFLKFIQEFREAVWANYERTYGHIGGVPDSVAKRFRDTYDTLEKLPYFPLFRDGRYGVALMTKNGPEDVRHFNSKAERDAMDVEMRHTYRHRLDREEKKPVKKREVWLATYDLKHDFGAQGRGARSYAGLPRQVVEQLADIAGKDITSSDRVAEMKLALSKLIPGSNFAGRLLKRRFVKGYDNDPYKAYMDYFQHGVNHLVRAKFGPLLREEIDRLWKNTRQIQHDTKNADNAAKIANYLEKHFGWFMNPQSEWAAARAWVFNMAFAFEPSSVAIQLTQVPLLTFPYLASRYGDIRAMKEIVKAMKDVRLHTTTGKGFTAEEQRMINDGIEQGFINESFGVDVATGGSQRLTSFTHRGRGNPAIQAMRGLNHWITSEGPNWFRMAEQYNRTVTALATFRMSNKYGAGRVGDDLKYRGEEFAVREQPGGGVYATSFERVRRAVNMTQFEYLDWNKPLLFRGKQSVLFIFQQFVQHSTFFGLTDPGATRYIALLAALGGIQALPFADDIMDILGAGSAVAARIFGGSPWNPRVFWRQFAKGLDLEPNLFMQGLGGGALPIELMSGWSLGHPADIGSRLGMGDILPGTEAIERLASGAYKNVPEFLGHVSTDVAGPIGQYPLKLLENAFAPVEMLANQKRFSDLKNLENLIPFRALRNPVRGWSYWQEGRATDKGDATLIEFGDERFSAAFKQALGFSSAEVKEEREKRWTTKIIEGYATMKFSSFATKGKEILQDLYAAKDPADKKMFKAEYNAWLRDINEWNKSDIVKDHPEMFINGEDLQSAVYNRMRSVILRSQGIPETKRARIIQHNITNDLFYSRQ